MIYKGISIFEGVKIKENERLTNSSGGRQNIVEFQVFLNGKFKASFRKLAHAINSICNSKGISFVGLNDFDKFFICEEAKNER